MEPPRHALRSALFCRLLRCVDIAEGNQQRVQTCLLKNVDSSFLLFSLFNVAEWVSVIPGDSVSLFLSSLSRCLIVLANPFLFQRMSGTFWWGMLEFLGTGFAWVGCRCQLALTGVSTRVCFQPWVLMLNWKAFLLSVFPQTLYSSGTSTCISPLVATTCCVYQCLLFKLFVLIPGVF